MIFILFLLGDGCFSFEEFVEIVSKKGKTSNNTAEEEEKELRDAFRVTISRSIEQICVKFFLSTYSFDHEEGNFFPG